jgi:guanine deaminase
MLKLKSMPGQTPRMNDEGFMRLALRKAQVGAVKGEPFGACVVLDGKVISCERSATEKNVDVSSHAEIVAIRKASRRLKTRFLDDCTVYSSCEPCPMCFYACVMARVSRIVFSATLDDLQSSGYSKHTYVSAKTMKRLSGSKIDLVSGLLRKEGRTVFRPWTQKA